LPESAYEAHYTSQSLLLAAVAFAQNTPAQPVSPNRRSGSDSVKVESVWDLVVRRAGDDPHRDLLAIALTIIVERLVSLRRSQVVRRVCYRSVSAWAPS
jgi:hypothetical protein